MMQAVVFLVAVLTGVSLVIGGVIALAVVLWAQDMAAAVRLISNGYYLLVGLMPIALWLAIFVTYQDKEYAPAYASPVRAILTALQGAIVGSILGGGPFFLAVVLNVPVLLADFEMGGFNPAVREAILWSRLLLAVGAAVASAIPLGLWAYYTRAGREDI